MAKAHRSFRELAADVHGDLESVGSHPERIDMTVSGNENVRREASLGNYNMEPSYRKSGGRVGHTHKAYFSDHHSYKVKGHR